MNLTFSKIAPVFKDCNFPVYIYQPEKSDFCQVIAGNIEKMPPPANMLEYLEDDNVFFKSFKKGDSFMAFYFLRLEIDDTKIIIMLNSDKERKAVNAIANSFHSTISESFESVRILRRSRQKMLKLLDGLIMPLFSISPDYEILNVNKELADFMGETNIPSIMGKKCYEVIHGRSEPCEFCRMKEIIDGEHVNAQNIKLERDGKTLHFEHHMFPIYDNTGEMNEVGEFMIDVTENYQMIASIEKYKQKVKKIQRAEVDKMNEIGELKKAYKDLESNYDEMFTKNRKMSKALERLLAEDNVNELIRLRQENREVKNKLVRSATALKNFQNNLDAQQEKYTDLSKKTVYQLERLINTMNKKSTISDTEMVKLLKMVTDDVKDLRNTLKITLPPNSEES
jgi:PAS domain-containing protein